MGKLCIPGVRIFMSFWEFCWPCNALLLDFCQSPSLAFWLYLWLSHPSSRLSLACLSLWLCPHSHFCLEQPCHIFTMPSQVLLVAPILLYVLKTLFSSRTTHKLFRMKSLLLSLLAVASLGWGGVSGTQCPGYGKVQIRFSVNIKSKMKETEPRNIRTDYWEDERPGRMRGGKRSAGFIKGEEVTWTPGPPTLTHSSPHTKGH